MSIAGTHWNAPAARRTLPSEVAMPTPTPTPTSMPTPTPTTDQSLAELLRATWFGATFESQPLERLAALGELLVAPAGTVLLAEGSPTDEFGVLISGRIALRTLVPDRGPVTVLTVEPGDVYGWSALVPPHRATSTAVATEPVVAAAFAGERLRAALAHDPELALALYPRVLEAVARRLAATRLQLLDLFGQREVEPW